MRYDGVIGIEVSRDGVRFFHPQIVKAPDQVNLCYGRLIFGGRWCGSGPSVSVPSSLLLSFHSLSLLLYGLMCLDR